MGTPFSAQSCLAASYVRQRTDDSQTSVHAGQEPETLTEINRAHR
jgi:hypothetical protein